MRTQPKSIFLLACVVFSLAAFLLAQAQRSHLEYSIRIVSTMAAVSPIAIGSVPTVSKLYFGRSDGSNGVRTTEVINGHSCTTTTYWEFVAHEQVTASDCVSMKSTIPFVGIPRHRGPVPTCTQTLGDFRVVNTETIQGLKVEKFEVNDQTTKSTLYLAPSLGCLVVRQLVYWKGTAGEVVSTTFDEPVEVKVGTAPDSSLFQADPAYREVLPSERRNALYNYFNGVSQPAACLRKNNEREDKKYLDAKKSVKASNGQSILARLWVRK